MDFKSLISKMDSIAAKKVLLESQETATGTDVTELSVDTESLEIVKENANSDIYNKLVESFGYIAELTQDEINAKLIKDQPAASFGANNLPGNKPSGGQPDTSRGSSSYTGDIGNATNDPVPGDQKTNVPVKPKAKFRHPGVRALQHFLTSSGFKVAIDGVLGDQTTRNAKALYDYWTTEQTRLMNLKAPDPKTAERKEKVSKNLNSLNELQAVSNALTGKPVSGKMMLGDKWFSDTMKEQGYDPKTGNPMPGAQSAKSDPAAAAAAPKKDAEVVKGQGGQADGPPADAPTNEPYWVSGTRYKWSWSDEKRGMAWVPNFKPGDWGLNSNQAAAKAGYTGPDSKKSDPQAQGTQIAGAPTGVINKESAELERIRKLSGM
jgi:hypothetical protein